MVTVTVVRVTSDLSLAKIYLSIFGGGSKEEVLESIKSQQKSHQTCIGSKSKESYSA